MDKIGYKNRSHEICDIKLTGNENLQTIPLVYKYKQQRLNVQIKQF